MKSQESSPEVHMQPHTVESPIPRPFTQHITGSGILDTRYDIKFPQEKRQYIVSWDKDFKEVPDIFIQEPGGRRRPANEDDFRERPFTIIDIEESEQASSVVPRDDLRYSAAPPGSLRQFRGFLSRWESNQGNAEDEFFMSVDELEEHLEHNGGGADTIKGLVEEKMLENFEESQEDGGYLPLDAFDAIFNIESIKSLVKEAYPENTKLMWLKTVAQIVGTERHQGYRRILGILVLTGRISYIGDFIREGIKDLDLPITRIHVNDKEFRIRGGAQNSTLFSSWSRTSVKLFYVYQRRLIRTSGVRPPESYDLLTPQYRSRKRTQRNVCTSP